MLLVLPDGRAFADGFTVVNEASRLNLPAVLPTDSLDNLDSKLASCALIVFRALRSRSNRVALHGATVFCLEALILGLAAPGSRTIASLERLKRLLREAIRRHGRPRPSSNALEGMA